MSQIQSRSHPTIPAIACLVYWYLAIIEWGWVGYEEFCRSKVLSTEVESEFYKCFISYSKQFAVLEGVLPFRSLFFCSPKKPRPCPQVFSVNGSITCSGLHFWRHFDVIGTKWENIGSIGQSSSHIWSTAAVYDEVCLCFKPIRYRKIFWMNNNVICCFNTRVCHLLLLLFLHTGCKFLYWSIRDCIRSSNPSANILGLTATKHCPWEKKIK